MYSDGRCQAVANRPEADTLVTFLPIIFPNDGFG